MASEDALQEAEALEAIFAEDFVKHTAESFTLTIRPATGADGACHVGIRLRITYLPGYPETAPDVLIEPEKGLNAKQFVEIRGIADEAVAENLGTPLVYALSERLRTWLDEHNEPPGDGSGFEEMMRRQKAAASAAEKAAPKGAFSLEEDPSVRAAGGTVRSRGGASVAALTPEEILAKRLREGTPVTPESFAAWRAAFEREAEAKRLADEAAGVVDPYAGHRLTAGRLTGRQLFESDAAGALALSDATPLAGEADAAAATAGGGPGSAAGGLVTYAVDAATYGGAGDLLPDDDDEDDEDYTPGADEGEDDDDAGDDEDGDEE